MAYWFDKGRSADDLLAVLASHAWRGQIVGPHGSGKSTLLATLCPFIEAAERRVRPITLRQGQRHLPAGWLREALAIPQVQLVIDGYEQLSWPIRQRVQWATRRARAGLIVTSHRDLGSPTLLTTRADLTTVQQLVRWLTRNSALAVGQSEVAASFARHGGNVREILFDLYDHYERRVRRA